ncbi:hypothetical protein Dda_3802 [Drechslerella dactyloides]|uniref:Uncharacterized protein n=1 Tax=Drechslerella dactyloides TaxID=74499 RepID=A0AAD6J2X9_DREDA|nr:hypothetical protein Dda_3802 [Drechslerella dactyloides]
MYKPNHLDHDVLSLCLTNKAISQVATVELHRSVTFVYTPAQAIDPEFFASIIYPNHRSFQHIRQLNIEHVPFLKNDPYTFNTSVPSNRNPVSAFLMCFFDRLAPNQLLSLSLDYFVLDLPTRYFPAQQKLSRLKLPAPVSEEQRNHIISLAAVTTLEITHIQPKRVCYVEQILHSKRERLQSLRLHFQPTRHEPRGAFSNEADVNGLKSLFRALSRDDATLGFSPAPHLVNVCLDALIVHEAFDMNWGEVFDLHNLRKFEIVHPVTRILKGMTLRMSSENISNMWNLTHLRLDDVRQVESLNHALVHIGPLRKLHLNLLQPGLSPSKAAMRPHKDSLEYLWLKCRPSPKPPLNIDDIENMPTQENKYIFSPEFNIADFKKLDQLAIPFDPEMISSLPRSSSATTDAEVHDTDDAWVKVDLEVPITIFGKTSNVAWFSMNGIISIDDPKGMRTVPERPLPVDPATCSSTPDQGCVPATAIMPLWRDLSMKAKTATLGLVMVYTYHAPANVPHYHILWNVCDKAEPMDSTPMSPTCGKALRYFRLTYSLDRPGYFTLEYPMSPDSKNIAGYIGVQSMQPGNPQNMTVNISDVCRPGKWCGKVIFDTAASKTTITYG